MIRVEQYHVGSLQLTANVLSVFGRHAVSDAEFHQLYVFIAVAKSKADIMQYLRKCYTKVKAHEKELNKLFDMYQFKV